MIFSSGRTSITSISEGIPDQKITIMAHESVTIASVSTKDLISNPPKSLKDWGGSYLYRWSARKTISKFQKWSLCNKGIHLFEGEDYVAKLGSSLTLRTKNGKSWHEIARNNGTENYDT